MREPPYDGVAEVWFDGPDLAPAQGCTPEYTAVRSDERNFIDPTTFGTIVTDEHVIKDGPAPSNGVKNIEFVSRRTGMPTERFQEYWRTVHGPLGAAIPVVLRYVQCHTRPSAYRTGHAAAYDGVALTWFSDTAAMRKSATLPEYDAVRADEPNFIDCGKLTFISATEHTIVSLD